LPIAMNNPQVGTIAHFPISASIAELNNAAAAISPPPSTYPA